MTVLNAHSVEINWISEGKEKIRQVVRSLCPLPVIVIALQKAPVEFAILVLPPWDSRFHDCLANSPLLTPKRKVKALEVIKKGLRSKLVDCHG